MVSYAIYFGVTIDFSFSGIPPGTVFSVYSIPPPRSPIPGVIPNPGPLQLQKRSARQGNRNLVITFFGSCRSRPAHALKIKLVIYGGLFLKLNTLGYYVFNVCYDHARGLVLGAGTGTIYAILLVVKGVGPEL
ncbi:hypothetical protein B0J17DRAFT_631395 [Rhizoctonia solani]|nr:hypothetical protein B0J17DRAFT_631395 [Rhizoctonia solani]